MEIRISRWWRSMQAFASISSNHTGLAYFRILFGLFLLVFETYHWGWLGHIPDALFNPTDLNVIRIFDTFPSSSFLAIADTLIVMLLLCITLGIKTRWCSLLAFFMVLVMNGFAYGFGKIDHEILVTTLFLVMAFTNSGVKLALWPDTPLPPVVQNIAIAFYAMAIAFGLFSAGFPKAIMWIDFDTSTSGILRWYYNGYYNLGRVDLLAPYFAHMPLWLLELADYIVPIFESLGFYFLLRSRRHWRLWLVLLCFFHLFNTLILNIPFTRHVLVYGFFLLPHVLPKNLPSTSKILVVIAPLALLLSTNHLYARLFLNTGSLYPLELTLYIGLVAWIILIAIALPDTWRSFIGKPGSTK